MPSRKYSATDSYRYGFNGQENSNEIFESSFTAEFWEYDSRIGRRWNIDPILKENESSYLCFSGNPILMSDPEGNDPRPKDGPYNNPKARRSVNKYKRHFEKELKRLGGDTEENRKKAFAYMNNYDVKKWMWIRHTSMEHMPKGNRDENMEIFYNAGNLFEIQLWEKDKVKLDRQPFVPLAYVKSMVTTSLDDDQDLANIHTYQLPEVLKVR